MNRVLAKLWSLFWHLLPANPILVRVVSGASRRPQHLYLRVGYLGALLGVFVLSLIVSMGGQSGSLADLARGASQTFKWASIAQLALMCFLAPVFAAAAITQERDAQTFGILLSTPLTNAQIVFGSLMSRLFFVILLLLAGLPIFLVTTVYGGVTTSQIFHSFALAGSTAILTGALAIFLSMIRVGTRGTIFSFYLLIGLYLLSLYLLGMWSTTWIDASPANIAGEKMSWLTPLHPFLALDVALNRVHPPPYGRLTDHAAVVRYALAYPSMFYVAWTATLAFVLTVLSVLFVRKSAKTGESTFFNALFDRFRKEERGQQTRQSRFVWANPVAWREARTRASSGGLLRWTLIAAGLIGASILFVSHVGGGMTAGEVRKWLAGLIIIQFALALIIATNTAATSMTKEKESKTMDLLLCTALTSRYILWGKLRGLLSLIFPLLLGPVIALLAFGIYGLGKQSPPPAVTIEAGIEVAALMVIYTAAACVIGLRVSLFTKKNVTAVMYSVGLVILLYGAATMLGLAVVEGAGGEFGMFLAPFTPFTSIRFLIDPVELFESTTEFTQAAYSTRVTAGFATAIAALAYALVIWSAYRGLVRNFDLIVRKQSSAIDV